ncbi:long-chain acyl-CoA synthetase [Coprinopsis sp. MPI-PUGE-AT-0042]|nr:long-chain acyl-CoA synthetase [Coprinopsis sp. MPI-PUGE-AT-0042]
MSQDRVIPFPPNPPLDRQGFPVFGTKKAGQSAHYRNAVWGLVDEHTPGVLATLDQCWEEGLRIGQNRDFMGWRPRLGPGKFANHYEWMSYTQADIRRRQIGSALHKLFHDGTLKGDVYDTVGLWSPNRPEWQLVDLACQSYNQVGVSLYDTLGKDSVEYIINHSSLAIIFASLEHIPALLKLAQASKIPTLKYIVSFDALTHDAKSAVQAWGENVNVKVIDLLEFEAIGAANPSPPIPATPDTIASICYTSGTTNTPKGVLLAHKTLALAVHAGFYGRDLPESAILLSYMPLAHIYERMSELCTIVTGGRIGYFSGDPLRLLEDAQILKPHIFPSVPRVLNRIYQSAMLAKEAPGLKGKLFQKALNTKLEELAKTGKTTHPLWDRIVFKKIQAALGGQVKFVASGSAPITPDVLNFLRVSFACEVVEGYGMTETAACCTRTWPDDLAAIGTVGPPAPVNEVKLVDVPGMGYTSEDQPFPRGEICVRGANVFVGYYKDDKNTKENLDSEGWFHTGDVASIDSAGRVKIIDRVKNIMKLSQGEYVALEKIENVYSTASVVAQVFVHGDGTQPYVVAVIVPEPVAFSALVQKVTGKRIGSVLPGVVPEGEVLKVLAEACRDERVVKCVLDTLNKEAQKGGLKGFEMVKRLHLTLTPFSVDDGTLTPTMKLRRKDAYNKYKADLDALYALGEPVSGSTVARVGSLKL